MKTMIKPSMKSKTSRSRRTVHAIATKPAKFSIAENLAALCGKYRDALTESSEFLQDKHRSALRER